jgi:hypothetical protein
MTPSSLQVQIPVLLGFSLLTLVLKSSSLADGKPLFCLLPISFSSALALAPSFYEECCAILLIGVPCLRSGTSRCDKGRQSLLPCLAPKSLVRLDFGEAHHPCALRKSYFKEKIGRG